MKMGYVETEVNNKHLIVASCWSSLFIFRSSILRQCIGDCGWEELHDEELAAILGSLPPHARTKREGNKLRFDANIILNWTSESVEDVA